ncbi:hypothetical protein [Methylobacterium haplocladii]|uniref:Uncharacterized protein n=1 Tax=Methylobacterium haplocladii TaxID=1176176 RepID=A0A512IP58_9HYPH|nr:hypothetical protein [Methylobacterium haplocladii]GEO99428.1 hypothetical protein MHA02_18160 [Methylobacterium haplocladii]GJD83256.1 hypothetical protein HPGCJGGD_1122 [Methylobacterium haplocladii]GLS60664.1 hypothetical protein GCM10007887_33480 [Methylobacterium haplocladii]
MARTMIRATVGAALVLLAGTGAAFAFGGSGGGSSGEGDGSLRQEMQNPRYVEPSRYAYRDGYQRNDPGAEYEAYRRGYPIYGPWGSKYRY